MIRSTMMDVRLSLNHLLDRAGTLTRFLDLSKQHFSHAWDLGLPEAWELDTPTPPGRRIELDELDAIVALVAKGVGMALVPQTATHRRWPASVRAIDLGRHTFYRDIGLVNRGSRPLTGPAGLLQKHAAGEAPTGQTVVITVTGHGLKDPQWAIKAAEREDPSLAEPTRVSFDVVAVAAALGLE